MKSILCVATLLFALVGCAGHEATPTPAYLLGDNLVAAGYTIADTLEENLKVTISKEQPIIVASFVNVNDLTQSSTFGRMLSEHVASRLSQKGYQVIELKLRQTSLFIQEGKGEFMLSRDVREIGLLHNASAVVVGTYGDSRERTYTSARIVRTDNSVVLSSCDYAVAKNYGLPPGF